MQNAFIILKLNKSYVDGGWDKWKKKIFFISIILTDILMGCQPFIYVLNNKNINPVICFIALMVICIYTLSLMYTLESFVPQRVINDINSRKNRDHRNYYIYMPFNFKDFIIAGYLAWVKWCLLSCIPLVYFTVIINISNNNGYAKTSVGFGIIINAIIYLLVGIGTFSVYAKNKLLRKAMRVLYNFSSVLWIFAGIIYGVLTFLNVNLSFLAGLCSPFGIVLNILLIPVIYILIILYINNNKGRSWRNE